MFTYFDVIDVVIAKIKAVHPDIDEAPVATERLKLR